ncbi:MAG: hypothetical protein AAF408_07280 [Pseudomonadota bacterium]
MRANTLDLSAEMPVNDCHLLPVTPKQLKFALAIARKTAVEIPAAAHRDRRAMSDWIAAHQPRETSPFERYPTGKQVAFAERIARIKRRHVPPECFRDKAMMSKWIDHNR